MLVGENHPVLGVANLGIGLPEVAVHVLSVDIGVNPHGAILLNVSNKIVQRYGEIMDKDCLEIARGVVLRFDADSVNSINNAEELIEDVVYGRVGVSDMDCRNVNRNGLAWHIKTFGELVIDIEFSLFLV
jgi:flavorubredoxin